MTSQISGLSAQVISLSQKVARLSAKTPGPPHKDFLCGHPSDLQHPCSWCTAAPSCQTDPKTITPEEVGRPRAAPPHCASARSYQSDLLCSSCRSWPRSRQILHRGYEEKETSAEGSFGIALQSE